MWEWFTGDKCAHCVLIFSRYPTPGDTKTRLCPTLGKEGAAYCQLLMTEHILDKLASNAANISQDVEVEIQYKGGSDSAMNYWLERRKSHLPHLTWTPQVEGDLGVKLRSAVAQKLQSGKKSVIIIGSDIPDISAEDVSEARSKLSSSADMVLGKANDGGYYLIGFNQKSIKYLDNIFDGVNWGTEHVFKQQKKNAEQNQAKMETLSRVLSDVDVADDLEVFERSLGMSKESLSKGDWSIIIPVLNEADGIKSTLNAVANNCSDPGCIKEVIVSDGGSKDGTLEELEECKKSLPFPLKVIHSEPGRGIQLRTGVSYAKGAHFLFLHADSILPKGYDKAAFRVLSHPGNVAGAFKFGLDVVQSNREIPLCKADEIFRKKMSWLEYFANRRSKNWELPYGDQGIFMSKKSYQLVGGFPSFYLMEDFVLVEKLRKIGHVAIADDVDPVITSSRRWKKWGLLRITGLNQIIVGLYKLGVHPNTLARWYYGDKLPKKQNT